MDINASGIYQIKNKTNGKIYIGSAKRFKRRWITHLSSLITNKHGNGHLQAAYNQDQSIFEYSILIYCDVKDLLFFEQRFLDAYYDKGINCYNISPTAGSPLGSKRTNECKLKMSLAKLGKKRGPRSKEHVKKIADANRGRKATTEAKRNMSLAHLGKLPTYRQFKLSIEEEKALIYEFSILKIPKTTLANKYNINKTSITHILERYGLYIRNTKTKLTEDEIMEIKALRNTGTIKKLICEKYKITWIFLTCLLNKQQTL